MGRSSRVLASAAALLALTVPLACGDDDGTASTGTTVTTAPTTTAQTTTTAGGGATTAAPATTAVMGMVIEVTVADGDVTGGGRKQVAKDELLTLRVTSDVADEVHVHGFDLSLDLQAGVPGELTFTPNAAGVYEVELEERGLQLLELEVR
jgi:heme/copper-type cytochrome/quinol oxidase subunit 2